MPNQPSGMRPEHMRSDLGIIVLHSKICNVSQMLHDKLKLYKITSILLQCSIF